MKDVCRRRDWTLSKMRPRLEAVKNKGGSAGSAIGVFVVPGK